MSERQYIGARYVPKVFDDGNGNSAWIKGISYEALTVVTRLGDSFTSKIPVPSTVSEPENNPKYWVHTADYNAQMTTIKDSIADLMSQFGYFNKVVPIESIKDFKEFATTEPVIILISDGAKHELSDVTIDENVTLMFINGYLSGEFTIEGKIVSTGGQIFDLQSTPHINLSKNPTGRPEYFGGFPNSKDCTDAINKCISVFNTIELSEGVYNIDSSINITDSNKTIYGVGTNANDYEGATTLLYSGDNEAFNIDGGTTYNLTNIKLKDFNIMSEKANVNNTGVRIFSGRRIVIDNVNFIDTNTGVYVDGIMYSHIKHCRFISRKNTANAFDSPMIFIAQSADVSTNISPTASLYIIDCDFHFNNHNSKDYGILSYGSKGLADLWIQSNNFFKCYHGISLKGSETNLLQQDIFIAYNAIDNCFDGIKIENNLKVNINNNWISTGNFETPTHALLIVNNTHYGCIISNNQFKSSDSMVLKSYGLRVTNCDGINFVSNILFNFTDPIYLSTCNNTTIKAVVSNNSKNTDTYFAIVESSKNMTIELTNTGTIKYGNGLHVLSNCSYITINPTAITSKASKVVIGAEEQTNADILKVLDNNNMIIGPIN